MEVPAVDRLLVMVQREVGERMAADGRGPRLRFGLGAGGLLRPVVGGGKVPASVFIPRPKVESVLVRMERRAEPAVPVEEVTYERLAAVVKAGFGQRRKMLRQLAGGRGRPRGLRRARHPARGPGRGARRSRSGGGWPDDPAAGSGQAHAVPRGDRGPPRRVPRARGRNGQPEPGDELTFTEGGRGLTLVAEPGDARRASARRCRQPHHAGAGRSRARGRRARCASGSRWAGGWAAGRRDAAAVLRWAGCTDPEVAAGAGIRRALQRGRGPGPGRGHRREVTPLDFEARRSCSLVPPFGVDTAQVYAAWDALGAPESRRAGATRSPRRRSRSSRDWPGGVTPSATSPGGQPTLAGSGSTWFVEVALPTLRRTALADPGRRAGAPYTGAHGAGGVGRELKGATSRPALPAGGLQHLLVLLLAHALAALLDQ